MIEGTAQTPVVRRGVYVLPGTVFDRPGHFRISLTATMEMLERALPALREAGTGRPAQAR